MVRHFADAGKPIAAICRGRNCWRPPGCWKGRRVVLPGGRPGSERGRRASSRGADRRAHVDGNLVTAPAWPRTQRGWRSFWRCWARR